MKKAIIIGSSSGIGRELAQQLVELGFRVGATGRRLKLLQELQEFNSTSIHVKSFDANAENALEHLDDLIETIGGLDLLIISAGTGDLNPRLDEGIVDSTNGLNVNAFSTIVVWAFHHFKNQGRGHLVNISSIAGLRGGKVAPSYNASKAYQINFLEGLRQKAQSEKLSMTLTDVRPGFVNTAMAKGDGQFWVAQPTKAAKQIVSAIHRKKDVVYITKRWQIIAVILKILPNWLYKRI